MAVRLEELAQGRHRHLVPAADVDAAQEDEVSGRASDVRRDAFGELLHDLDLRVVFEERQVAACHELDRDRHLVPDVEQRLDELIGRAGVRGPARRSLSASPSNGGGEAGGSDRVADASMSEYFQFSAQTASR